MSNILVHEKNNENNHNYKENGNNNILKDIKYVNFEVVSNSEIEKDILSEDDFE